MRPLVYCASSHKRALMWRTITTSLDCFKEVKVCSTWFKSNTLEADEKDPVVSAIGWDKNLHELMDADYLLVYAEPADRPEGTFVEIGMAVGMGIPIVLVGLYPWGSWQYLKKIRTIPTFREAIEYIVADHNRLEKEISDDA